MHRPTPADPAEKARWLHSATRYRMLSGDWDQDLLDWCSLHLDEERMTLLGQIDTSSNAFKQACQLQSAMTYREAPTVGHPTADISVLLDAFDKAGLWTKMPRIHYYTTGLREMVLRPDVDDDGLTIRQVFPHNVLAWADARRPDVPVRLWELRERVVGDELVVAWDQADISNPANPTFRVVQDGRPGEEATDITEAVFGKTLDGENYPFWLPDGTPVVPYGMRHAEDTGDLWDPYFGREAVRGTLTSAMLQSFTVRAAHSVTGNVVLGINCNFGSLRVLQQGGEGAAKVVPMEPGSMHEVQPRTKDGPPPSIVVIPPGAELDKLAAHCDDYEKRVLYRAGVKPPDPTAQHGDARSGYALGLDDRGRREQAQAMEPMARRADLELIQLCALMLNLHAGRDLLPLDGYTIRYGSIPLTPEEERERRERLTWEYSAGIIEGWELVQAYLPGITEQEARLRASRGNLQSLIQSANLAAGRAGRGAVT